jgi:anaerobic magnesium-protoporphyrin IX monomethyl ester cyclase
MQKSKKQIYTVILFYPKVEQHNHNNNLPYSLLYLERSIREFNLNVIIIDERVSPNYEDIIIKHKKNLLLCGISCMIGYQIIGALRFNKIVKKHTDSKIIWGGWLPSIFTNTITNIDTIDFICIGQGETPFKEITKSMLVGNFFPNIQGIINVKSAQDSITIQPLKEQTPNTGLDFNLIDVNKIIDINGIMESGNRGTDYLATYGCPNNCSFCNLAYIYGKRWYAKEIKEIMADILDLIKIGNINYLTLSDDNFFVNRSFVLSFCESLINQNLGLKWEANAHAGHFLKTFNDNDLKIIKKSGCTMIKIGAESGDQEVLDKINKKSTVEDNLNIVKLLSKHNISLRFFTMIAFPFNPNKDFNKTLSLITKARFINPKVDFNINIFKPLPKTNLSKIIEDSGFRFPSNVLEINDIFDNHVVYPWHKRNYYWHLETFIQIYAPFANSHYYKNYKSSRRILFYLLNKVFFIIIKIRTFFNFWWSPTFATILRIKSNKKNLDYLKTEPLKSRVIQ